MKRLHFGQATSGNPPARRKILRDIGITVAVLLVAAVICYMLSHAFDDNNPFASSVFILAVALISLFTDGFAYGVAASVIGVFCVNYIFTYPFWSFNMELYGYPLTFFVMLVVSVLISFLTARLKKQEAIKAEAAREKLRADLLRSVSHDIRTPLAAIVGASSVLMENPALTGAEKYALAADIHRGADFLVHLTENILTVTRLSGDVQLEKQDEVFEEIVGSAIGRYKKSGGTLPVHVTKPADILFVPMNAGLIEQVLVNLLQNILAHAPTATKAVIDITAGNKLLTCAVSDDGEGFAPETALHAFDGTLRVGNGRCADGARGTGTGLSVCRAIIAAHGGEITAANNASGGATVSFTLPMGGGRIARWV